MTTYLASIRVMLKPLVNDPQGLAVAGGLRDLGYDAVQSVRVGKRIELTLAAPDAAAAVIEDFDGAGDVNERLLANP